MNLRTQFYLLYTVCLFRSVCLSVFSRSPDILLEIPVLFFTHSFLMLVGCEKLWDQISSDVILYSLQVRILVSRFLKQRSFNVLMPKTSKYDNLVRDSPPKIYLKINNCLCKKKNIYIYIYIYMCVCVFQIYFIYTVYMCVSVLLIYLSRLIASKIKVFVYIIYMCLLCIFIMYI